MIPNCEGCYYEFKMALEEQEKGLHLATTKKQAGIGSRDHLSIIMVDDKGGVVWK